MCCHTSSSEGSDFFCFSGMCQVYKEPLFRRYYVSSACSAACVYMIVILGLMIFLPLFLAYNSTGKAICSIVPPTLTACADTPLPTLNLSSFSAFWLKDSMLYEQPHIQYSYQAIFQFYGDRCVRE